MVFCLQTDGVRIHWLTDGPFDRTDLSPENMSGVLPGINSPPPLPLNPGAWNQLTIAVNEQLATLHLNGQRICEAKIDTSNDRVFGLFHFANQTEARVRNVTMRGNWPRLRRVSFRLRPENGPAMANRSLPICQTAALIHLAS